MLAAPTVMDLAHVVARIFFVVAGRLRVRRHRVATIAGTVFNPSMTTRARTRVTRRRYLRLNKYQEPMEPSSLACNHFQSTASLAKFTQLGVQLGTLIQHVDPAR